MSLELPELMRLRKVVRTADLVAGGVTRHTLRRLLAARMVVQPDLPGDGPEHGIYIDAEFVDHPDATEAIISVITDGGIFCGQYAAWRHGLSSVITRTYDIVVPADDRVRERKLLTVHRTRSEANLTLGIMDVPNDLGVRVRMTNPARTVIDLLRARHRNMDDFRHGVESFRSFVATGGDTGELHDLSTKFESWLPETLDVLGEGVLGGEMQP